MDTKASHLVVGTHTHTAVSTKLTLFLSSKRSFRDFLVSLSVHVVLEKRSLPELNSSVLWNSYFQV